MLSSLVTVSIRFRFAILALLGVLLVGGGAAARYLDNFICQCLALTLEL